MLFRQGMQGMSQNYSIKGTVRWHRNQAASLYALSNAASLYAFNLSKDNQPTLNMYASLARCMQTNFFIAVCTEGTASGSQADGMKGMHKSLYLDCKLLGGGRGWGGLGRVRGGGVIV